MGQNCSVFKCRHLTLLDLGSYWRLCRWCLRMRRKSTRLSLSNGLARFLGRSSKAFEPPMAVDLRQERSWTIIAKDYVGLTSAVIDNAVPRKLGKYHHQQQHLVYKDGSDDDFDKAVFCFQMCNMTSVIMITIIIFGPWELKHSAWKGWF